MAGAKKLEDYYRGLAPERRRPLRELHEWVAKVLPAAEVTMGYRMPTFEMEGPDGPAPVCAIAAQKHYFALYVCGKSALDANREAFAALDVGKGCIRFKALGDLPRTAARRVLRSAAREVRTGRAAH